MRLAALLLVGGCLSTPTRPLATGDAGSDVAVDTPTFTTRHWVKPVYTAGPPVVAPSLAYDAERKEVLLYGGQFVAGDPPSAGMYRLTSAGWTKVCEPCMPGARVGASFAYDPSRRVVVLVGGYVASTFADRFFYEWDGTAWTKTSVQLPSDRTGSSLVFDPGRNKLILLGGADGIDSRVDVLAYDGASLQSLPNIPLEAHNGTYSAAYDIANAQLVAFPGNGASTSSGGDEVIALSTASASWSTVCTACGAYRRVPVHIYDPVLAQLLRIAGEDMNDGLVSGTWAFINNQWTMVTSDPPGRAQAAVAYDASRDTIVLYGGYGGAPCGGNGNCEETWEMVPN